VSEGTSTANNGNNNSDSASNNNNNNSNNNNDDDSDSNNNNNSTSQEAKLALKHIEDVLGVSFDRYTKQMREELEKVPAEELLQLSAKKGAAIKEKSPSGDLIAPMPQDAVGQLLQRLQDRRENIIKRALTSQRSSREKTNLQEAASPEAVVESMMLELCRSNVVPIYKMLAECDELNNRFYDDLFRWNAERTVPGKLESRPGPWDLGEKVGPGSKSGSRSGELTDLRLSPISTPDLDLPMVMNWSRISPKVQKRIDRCPHIPNLIDRSLERTWYLKRSMQYAATSVSRLHAQMLTRKGLFSWDSSFIQSSGVSVKTTVFTMGSDAVNLSSINFWLTEEADLWIKRSKALFRRYNAIAPLPMHYYNWTYLSLLEGGGGGEERGGGAEGEAEEEEEDEDDEEHLAGNYPVYPDDEDRFYYEEGEPLAPLGSEHGDGVDMHTVYDSDSGSDDVMMMELTPGELAELSDDDDDEDTPLQWRLQHLRRLADADANARDEGYQHHQLLLAQQQALQQQQQPQQPKNLGYLTLANSMTASSAASSLVEYEEGDPRAHECARAPGWCSCQGTAYYGAFKKELPMHEMTMSGFTMKHVEGWIYCSASHLGGDPHYGYYKHCFCQVPRASRATYCAAEGQWCRCGGVVFYGGHYNQIQVSELSSNGFVKQTVEASISCTNTELKHDPAPGLHKTCVCQTTGTTVATHCAKEGELCTCQGSVWYGMPKHSVQATELTNNGFKSHAVHGSISCSAYGFGNDPHWGYHKVCYCEIVGSTHAYRCAQEGGYCTCPGDAYYGHHFPAGITVADLTNNGFEALSSYDSVDCGASWATDPAYGYWKLCFCVPKTFEREQSAEYLVNVLEQARERSRLLNISASRAIDTAASLAIEIDDHTGTSLWDPVTLEVTFAEAHEAHAVMEADCRNLTYLNDIILRDFGYWMDRAFEVEDVIYNKEVAPLLK